MSNLVLKGCFLHPSLISSGKGRATSAGMGFSQQEFGQNGGLAALDVPRSTAGISISPRIRSQRHPTPAGWVVGEFFTLP
ncbi:hypothetical protein ADN00_04615 [Ornatilinea apprima]|uniref:Uncharacterized protein n=1 Tax=Ornatilinea apprima TaxID=1134406 RepID=A0A0P6YB43_9CHLR|nr:hypothetical protein ADN00_04615 [Ornatilinea apprima]